MTTVVTPGLGKIEDLFRDLIWDNLVEAGIAALFIEVPWLNAWPIGGAVKYLLRLFSDKVFDGVRMSVDLSLIAFMNQEHKKAYDTEVVKLKIIAHSYGVDSPEFKKEKENAKEILAKFVAINH